MNAKNMARLGGGDKSGGSTYDEPATPAAAKRRALTGCKFQSARREAGVTSEKECNIRVFGGDVNFMLEALRRRDCPTCAFGIAE